MMRSGGNDLPDQGGPTATGRSAAVALGPPELEPPRAVLRRVRFRTRLVLRRAGIGPSRRLQAIRRWLAARVTGRSAV